MPIVVVTRARMAKPRFILPFMWQCLRISLEARRAEGYVAGALRLSSGPEFWTLTVWDGGIAMQAFRNSGLHGAVMPQLAKWADEASTAIWRTADHERPDWAEVQGRIEAAPRFTHVDAPSDAHLGAVVRPAPNLSAALPVPRATKARTGASTR